MAKTRAQRKAERRRRQQQAQQGQQSQAQAQRDTQVPKTADEVEANLAEQGADLEALKGKPDEQPEAPAPSRADVGRPKERESEQLSRRERRRQERERRKAAKESERRRAPKEEPVEKQRGAIMGFLASCVAELRRVQWPDRETLIQASAITLVFIGIMAAYLGILDAIFNWLVQAIL